LKDSPLPPLLRSFTRSQIASAIATAVDYGFFVLCVEALAVWYAAATPLGAVAGAITHFSLGRYWCFEAYGGSLRAQGLKYAAVSLTSLLLNTVGVYLLTDWGGIQYMMSRVITGLFVGIGFNFPLHRGYVFR